MKKQAYEKPSMKVVKIQQQHIICTSPNGMSGQTLSTYRGGSNAVTDDDGDDALW